MSIFKDRDYLIIFRYLLIPHIIFTSLLLVETLGSKQFFTSNIDYYQFVFIEITIRVIVFGIYLIFFTKGLRKLNEKINFSNQLIKMHSVFLAIVLTMIAIVIISFIPFVGKIAIVFLLPIIIDMIFVKKICNNEITLSWQEFKDTFNYYKIFSIKLLLGIIGTFLVFIVLFYVVVDSVLPIYNSPFLLDFLFYFSLYFSLFMFILMIFILYIVSIIFTYVIKNTSSKYQA